MGAKVTKNDRLAASIKKELRSRMNAAANVVRNEVLLSLNVTQPKRTVVSRNGKLRVIGLSPSREGQPPKKLTGKLFGSIVAGVRERGDRLEGVIGSKDEKAARLEFGFQGVDSRGRSVSQGARPFMRPALKKKAAEVKRIMNKGS